MLLLPLHQTPFKVKIGRKYGLVGANGAGKSTLMRAIAGGNLAGFPTELITVYVECEIIGEKADMTVLQYIMTDSKVRNCLLYQSPTHLSALSPPITVIVT